MLRLLRCLILLSLGLVCPVQQADAQSVRSSSQMRVGGAPLLDMVSEIPSEAARILNASLATFEEPPPEAFAEDVVLDLDQYLLFEGPGEPAWDWQLLPSGLIYRPYLASRKESRLATYILRSRGDSTFWAGNLGAQVGVLRFGSRDPYYPEGYQLDVEAGADIRLDIPNDVIVRGTDFRVGLPFSYGSGRHRIRFGYYHISSHTGDEFLLENRDFVRLNFSRDALILGGAYFVNPKTRLYGEAGWAFHSDISEPWEFQFGVDHAPYLPTGLHGELFWAIHGHIREEVRFGGNVSAQVGWAWVGETGQRLRAGLQYFNGKSNQYSFFNEHEQQIGVGIWYDL